MRDAYIVSSVRTPGGKRSKGAFKDTRPEDLLSFILKAAVDSAQNLEMQQVEDILVTKVKALVAEAKAKSAAP